MHTIIPLATEHWHEYAWKNKTEENLDAYMYIYAMQYMHYGAVHKVCHAPRGEGVWESVTVCDRGRGGKDCVTSHFQFFHNS